MSLTTLDPRVALIVVDLQRGIVAIPAAHPVGEVLMHARELADAFRRQGLPVVLVKAGGLPPGRTERPRRFAQLPAGWDELVPELDRQPGDHIVVKQQWGAFTNTGLKDFLDASGITQVVIAGVSTSIGVESTARQAHEFGFNVTLALDAMTDSSPEAHFNSSTRIFPRLGETGSAGEIITLLDSTCK